MRKNVHVSYTWYKSLIKGFFDCQVWKISGNTFMKSRISTEMTCQKLGKLLSILLQWLVKIILYKISSNVLEPKSYFSEVCNVFIKFSGPSESGDHSYCALVGPGTNFYLGQKLYSAKLLPMNSKVFSPIVKLKHYYLKKHLNRSTNKWPISDNKTYKKYK